MYLFWLFRAKIRIIPRTGLLCASWFHSGKTVHVLTFLFFVFIRHVKPFSKFFDICLMSYVYVLNLPFFCGICNTCLMYFAFSLFRTKKAGENCALFFPARCILIPFEWLLTFYSPTALSPLLSRPAPYKPSGVSKAPACYTSDASPLHTAPRWNHDLRWLP